MENEFKPTRADLSTIHDRLSELALKKAKLIDRKMVVQQGLSVYREKYLNVEYMGSEFNKIKESRANLKSELNYLESEIKKIKDEVAFKNRLKNEIDQYLKTNRTPLEQSDILKKITDRLNQLKKRYAEFSTDRTRVASLRVMASEFRDDLEKILSEIK